MVSPISLNRSLLIPLVKAMGINTQIVVKVEATIAPATCFAPSIAASIAGTPSLRKR